MVQKLNQVIVRILSLDLGILDLQAFNQEINIKHKKHFVSILNQIKMCPGQLDLIKNVVLNKR